MSTSSKIDFEPGLFGDEHPDSDNQVQQKKGVRRLNRAPIIVAGSLLFVLAAMAAINTFDFSAKMRGEGFGVSNILPPPIDQLSAAPVDRVSNIPYGIIPARQNVHDIYARASDGFCGGNEAMCSTITTDKPAEALAQIAAIVPKEQGKHYRLQVSVTAIDEE